ncbi:branched-chain amino acid aminotransferase [Sporolactobacillus terrae]|uniref:Branched-chain-amino-acid aminotransferase n=1 Tax=Sporolactobacillus terrae TaxID=269673 RepID=A0A410DC67_9BACL|nr:branched-chain amino acid aminotransferase [Sporolactobacillus terrae]QAA23723.1 branched-chain amino acid aminotransferase [Sporolactobacillus terrae]QAA26695.1 branched-chain amino acid aminotransferase [Sporolactobacillus terrae]UAK15760.1 branched-chain amino acid aminotransferase [Sporolactobacillus terrae]BBO00253.1 branched-chain-amino-acid aminotransferase 2 [Sporolactobacillus terrae]
MGQSITFKKADHLKEKPGSAKLGFGKLFTDYMFEMDYSTEKGWHDARIVPYGPIQLDPAATIFHYGQEVFEGLKAYRTEDKRVLLFRPDKNMARMNQSCDRLNIPKIDEKFVIKAIKKLVAIEEAWIPSEPGQSLYIRPFIIGTDAALGVHPSATYKLLIILSPVGAYFGNSMSPVKIYVEDEFVRAVKGGVGYAKTAGNYAASLKAQTKSEKLGFDQVLWLDGVEHKYIEEVGSMNIFFKIDDEVWTPALNGSILPGVTRASVIELLKKWGITVKEKKVSVNKLFKKAEKQKLKEVFGTGTAAVISPVGFLKWEDHVIKVANGKTGKLSQKLYDTITGIQSGKIEDKLGWTQEVKLQKEKEAVAE